MARADVLARRQLWRSPTQLHPSADQTASVSGLRTVCCEETSLPKVSIPLPQDRPQVPTLKFLTTLHTATLEAQLLAGQSGIQVRACVAHWFCAISFIHLPREGPAVNLLHASMVCVHMSVPAICASSLLGIIPLYTHTVH